MGTALGLVWAGGWGMLSAWIGFTLPSALAISALAWVIVSRRWSLSAFFRIVDRCAPVWVVALAAVAGQVQAAIVTRL